MSTHGGSADKVERNSFRFLARTDRSTWINGVNSVLLFALAFLLPSFVAGADFSTDIQPLISKYCLGCHSTEKQKGELDLERFKSQAEVRKDAKVWQQVLHQFEIGEMPPEGKPQPTAEEFGQLKTWIQGALDAEALARAGDPGPVVLRRLNNAEYTYTIQDLTEVALDPAKKFPVDGAAGEGFLNTGASLSMSPAMIDKQLAAAKDVASHAVLTPSGMRFSESDLRGDWVNEILDQIRAIYLKHTGGGAVDLSYQSQTVPPTPRNASDGRLDVAPYLAALIKHRERLITKPSAAADIARGAGLNPKYGVRLATALSTAGPKDVLLNNVRKRWREIGADETAALASEIRGWLDQLWRFDTIGQLGRVRPWQAPTTPLVESRDFNIALKAPSSGDDPILHLFAGSAGDGSDSDVVVWRQPRIARQGKPDVMLRDVRGGVAVLRAKAPRVMADTERYLAAMFELRANADASFADVAGKREVEPGFLRAWLETLGIVSDGSPMISEYLHSRLNGVGGYSEVKGWDVPGQSALSLVANSSDQLRKVPGDIRPGTIAVHPRPERWVAAGWLSPIDVEARIVPSVRDAHNACGNGVSWKLEHRRGSSRRILAEGNVDLGKIADIEPIAQLSLRKGDLISLVIHARDRSHGCDLTEIDLAIEPLGEADRAWSLSRDCAADIHAGNPHADRFGNQGVWHFYTGLDDAGSAAASLIPAGSLLDQWMNEKDAGQAAGIARNVARLLAPSPLSLKEFMAANPEFSEADKTVRARIVSLHGPLFSRIDLAEMAAQATPEQVKRSEVGLDPALFDAQGNLQVQAPQVVSFKLPAGLFVSGAFRTTGALHDKDGLDGSVQFDVATSAPGDPDSLRARLPVIARKGGGAAKRLEDSFAAFRELFPAALCFTRIVPADEVVTMLMFYREDAQLARLMLTDEEKAELDRLWDELEFVSGEPRRLVTAYEQLWQFATQGGDPKKFEPFEAGIRADAAKYESRLIETEPVHLDALIAFADKAWRRPLKPAESHGLRTLYRKLRSDDMPHGEAFRLTLARVLTSPAFLFKAETPAPGTKAAPVNAHELATRLSYFLWSSTPDAALREAAASGALLKDDELIVQTRRLLRDPRARRLAIEFACQWLHLRGFDELDEKSERKFPEFAKLKGPMYEETIRFFTDLIQNDRSLLSILDADHTFVNDTLAAHYGFVVADEPNSKWRRVGGLRDKGRGGILAQASTLARQSGASRTSPILRGNWIVETLLGERLPRPPADVPVLPDDPAGPALNMREVTERHTRDPACAKCHKRIDPFGFALEQFDAIGRRRADKRNVATILPDGKQIEGLAGLRDYLLTERHDRFVRTFCRKLLGFALGRPVQLSDEPLLKEIALALEENDHRFAVAVEKIVLSKQFREIRGNGLLPQ
jgi:hypothetical protein